MRSLSCTTDINFKTNHCLFGLIFYSLNYWRERVEKQFGKMKKVIPHENYCPCKKYRIASKTKTRKSTRHNITYFWLGWPFGHPSIALAMVQLHVEMEWALSFHPIHRPMVYRSEYSIPQSYPYQSDPNV